MEPGEGDQTVIFALVQAGITRVVVGIRQPLQHLRGQAIRALRSQGLQVDVFGEDLQSKIMEEARISKSCLLVNAPLIHRDEVVEFDTLNLRDVMAYFHDRGYFSILWERVKARNVVFKLARDRDKPYQGNRGFPVIHLDKFIFGKNGNVHLQKGYGIAWSTNTAGQKVTSMELQDLGNLVLLGESDDVLWHSFSHKAYTLLSGQVFLEGMRLESFPKSDNLSAYLEFKSGDVVLYVGYQTRRTYWSWANDSRKTNNSVNKKVYSASLVANAWNFYDENKELLWTFILSRSTDENGTWDAILGSDGVITFSNLQQGKFVAPEAVQIPPNSCGTPEPCGPFLVCYFDNWLDYFAHGFVTPFANYDLDGCKEAFLCNCSCPALFFGNSTWSCFLFDQIGSLLRCQQGSPGYVSYIKISSGKDDEGRNERKPIIYMVLIIFVTILVIAGLVYVGYWYLFNLEDKVFFWVGVMIEF